MGEGKTFQFEEKHFSIGAPGIASVRHEAFL